MSDELINEEQPVVPVVEGETVVDQEELDAPKDLIDSLVNEEKVEEPVVEQKEEAAPVEEVAKPVVAKESKPAKPAKKVEAVADETVAVFSTKNVVWSGVGKVFRGYNIVTKEQADQWVTRNHIRLATPEEVAKEFGL